MPRTHWTLLVVRRMDRFYSEFFGDSAGEIDKHLLADGWQLRASLEAAKPVFSTVRWPKDGGSVANAKFLGGMVGHSVAHYHALCEEPLWNRICEGLNGLKLISEKLEPKTDHSGLLLDARKNPFQEARAGFDSTVACVLRHAGSQSLTEQTHFFDGYAKALRRGSLDSKGQPKGWKTTTPAFQMLSIFGPILRQCCGSVHDVHRFLEVALGKQCAGSIKRTESLCRTIDLRLRPSGRPRGQVEKS